MNEEQQKAMLRLIDSAHHAIRAFNFQSDESDDPLFQVESARDKWERNVKGYSISSDNELELNLRALNILLWEIIRSGGLWVK